MGSPTWGVGRAEDENDQERLDRLLRIAELLCEPQITEDDADRLTSLEQALALADGDLAADLELVARAIRMEQRRRPSSCRKRAAPRGA
jgi:hypothetical protein